MGAKAAAAAETPPDGPKKGSKKKLILIALPVVLLAAGGGGAYFAGLLPFGRAKPQQEAENKPAAPAAPVFAELPDIVANLNTGGRRSSFVKLKARLELSKPEDQAALQAAMPRVLDLFQSYLREMRPEELRSSAGTWRLREELMARASLASAPARIKDVLFTEILVQ